MKRAFLFFPGLQEGLPEKRETEKLEADTRRDFGRKSPVVVSFSGARSFPGRVGSEIREVSHVGALDASESGNISPLEGENMTDHHFAIPKGMVFL